MNQTARASAAGILVIVLAAGCSAEAERRRHLSRGDKYFSESEYEKAKIEYLNVLKVEPQNSAAIRQLGLIWSEQGAPLRALPFLAKARELEPANLDLRLKFAYSLLSVRQVAEARKEALEILERAPEHGDALLVLSDTARTAEELEDVRLRADSLRKPGNAIADLVTTNLAIKRGDLDAAQSAIDRALTADPGSAQAQMAKANLYLAKRAFEVAGAAYKKGAELSPVRSVARVRYGEYLAQRGKPEEGLAWLANVARSAPDFIPVWNAQAQLALNEKKFDLALAALQHVFAIDGSNVEGRLVEGQVRLAKNQLKEAVECLASLDKTNPGVPMIKYQLARAYFRSGETSKALTAVEEAISKAPDFADAILLRGEIQLRAGNAEAVIEATLALLKKQPESSQAQLLLAEAYRASGRLAEAAGVLQEQLKVSPRNARPQLLLGLVRRQQGKVGEAREAFETAEGLVPDSLLPTSQLVDLDLAEKDYAAALRRVEDRLSKDPKLAGAYFLKGRIHRAQGEWQSAETALLKGIELDVNLLAAYDLLSSVYISAGKFDRAIEQINELIAKDPNNVRPLMLSGVVHTQMKQFEKAQHSYERLLAFQPDFVPALNNLAWIYSEKLNQREKALALGRKARSLRPSDPVVADTYGWTLYRSGEYQQSLAILREAAAELSGNPEVLYHLGMAAYTMGEKELSLRSLEAAAKSTSDFEGKEEIPAMVGLLRSAEGLSLVDSISQLKKHLDARPDDAVAWSRLGDAYASQGSMQEGAAAYEKAIQLNPKLASAMASLAELRAKEPGGREKALLLAQSARELAPDDPGIAGKVGRVAYECGNHAWAYSLLQTSARARTPPPTVLFDLAWAAYALGRVDASLDAMKRFIATAPTGVIAEEAQRFVRFVSAGPAAPAVPQDEFSAVLKTTPGYIPALMLRGENERIAGDRVSAINTYTEVLRKYPAFTPAQKRLALLYAQQPETREKAYELAIEARKTLPDDLEVTRTLGILSYHRGEFAAASKLLESAPGDSQLNATELFYLGLAKWKSNDPAGANKALAAALSAGLDEPSEQEARRVLQLQQSK